MKVKLITVCTDPNDAGLQQLKRSLDEYKWNYEILVAPEWKGFGTKLLTVYAYLQNTDVDAIFFCDAYDCVVLATMEEALSEIEDNYGLDKMVFSAERGCWPKPDYAKYYEPILEHGYNFLNSGLYYAPKEFYIKLLDKYMPDFESDDQMYFTDKYLFEGGSKIVLDQNCEVFQSYSFIQDDDYFYGEGVLHNLKTKTIPILIHGNGRTDLTPIYNLK